MKAEISGPLEEIGITLYAESNAEKLLLNELCEQLKRGRALLSGTYMSGPMTYLSLYQKKTAPDHSEAAASQVSRG